MWGGQGDRYRRGGRLPQPGRREGYASQPPACAPAGKKVFDKLRTKFGTVLVVVDQPTSIGALPLTVARETDRQVAYLPRLAMWRIADLYSSKAKTDAKNTAVMWGH